MKISHPIQRRIYMDIEGILNKLRDESNYFVDCNDGSAYKELYASEINTLLEHIDDLESRCQAVIKV